VLARLTHKSLVVADETLAGAGHYLLLETVRDYARQKLALHGMEEMSTLRDRHTDFYLVLVQKLSLTRWPDRHLKHVTGTPMPCGRLTRSTTTSAQRSPVSGVGVRR
jgi:predicted ATPase